MPADRRAAADAIVGRPGRHDGLISIGHRLVTLNLDALAELAGLSPWATYCRSKLANVRFANELARRLVLTGRDGASNSLHPGIDPGSKFSRALPTPTPQIGRLAGRLPMTDSVQDGATAIVYLAADEVAGVTGKYYARCSERRPAPDATDVDAQRDLWRQSVELLNIEEPLPEPDEEN